MKKFLKLGKRMMALFIVVLLNINSYAAVGANDGSAFVTKAEFDALINTFNEQMDTYQSGLNAKIDGAIANYLAGLSSVQVKNVDNISYTSSQDGILSVISYDNVQWSDGMMALSMSFVLVDAWLGGNTYKSNGTLMRARAKNPTTFNEIGLKELNEARTLGVWAGVCDTYQNTGIVGKNVNSNPQHVTSGERLVLNPNLYMTSCSNVKFIPDITEGGSELFTFGSASSSSTEVGNYLRIYTGDVVCTREINRVRQSKIINVKKSQEFKLFSDFDKVRDFCNDDDNKGIHTAITGLGDIMNDSSSLYWIVFGGGDDGKYSYTNAMGNKWGANAKKVRPYFGFIKTLQDWDKVLIEDYDQYIENMKKYQSDIKVAKTADHGNEHLYVSSGSPIAFVEKDATVTMPIEFADKTKDYDLWVKVGAFDITKEITDDNKDYLLYNNIKVKYKADEGSFVDAREGSATYSIRIEKGYSEIKFKMPKDGYIFLKWSYSSNSAAGGGTYKPSKTIQVETE